MAMETPPGQEHPTAPRPCVGWWIPHDGAPMTDMTYGLSRCDAGGRAPSRSMARLVAVGAMAAIAAGCASGPSRVTAPRIDASSAASGAIRLCDRDGNGAVSPAEAAASPGLAAAFERIDTDRDGSLSAAEIAARIADWANHGVGIVAQPVQITWNGKALSGGRVELVPEPYLKRWLKPAGSAIAPNGTCRPSLPPEDLPQGLRTGMHCGLYTVRITHPTVNVPARYNKESILGIEMRPDQDPFDPPRLALEASTAAR